MIDRQATLRRLAEEQQRPVSSVLRSYLLQAVLRRWSASAQADQFILRGGLMTQLWVGYQRRATRDLDWVGLFDRDLNATRDRLVEILTTPIEDDGVYFGLETIRGEVIWQETDFPGLRYHLQVHVFDEINDLQIDVGFGDPILPAAQWIEYPCLIGPASRLLAVTPELLVAWKLDGLFDHGAKRWPAKDLYDLYLLTRYCSLDKVILSESIRVAFEAHSDSLEDIARVLYNPSWWQTDVARNKWAKLIAASEVPVPSDLARVAHDVGEALRPAVERLIALPRREAREPPMGQANASEG